MGQLDSKVAVITGASGIRAATAVRFSAAQAPRSS
jgi:NADP-dependent 3-hydroxy acid dehydrogenase YdfG